MANRLIFKGDSYAIRRPFYIIPLTEVITNPDGTLTPRPFDLSGCTVRTTFKAAATPPDTDPADANAPIKADIAIAMDGTVTSSNGLVIPAGLTAADGILHHRLTKEQTGGLTVGEKWVSDVQVTDALGEDFTKTFEETVEVILGITNRGAA